MQIDYKPAPTIEEFIKDYIPGELFYSFIVGPFGCLAENTLVLTEFGAIPISDIDRPMRVLSWNEKTCRFQLSLSSGSYPKGRDYLYRVTTSEGEFDAAGQHQLLCADGVYRQVEDLHPGDVLASYSQIQHPTTEELSQSGSPLDAPHYLQTDVDSLGHYAASARQHGQQLLAGEHSDPDAAPLRDGAQKYEVPASLCTSGRMGDLRARSHKHSHQGICDGPRQKPHCDVLPDSRRAILGGPGEVEFFGHVEDSVRLGLQFLVSFWSRLRVQLRGGRFLRILGCGAFISPSLRVTNRAIISVVRQDVKRSFWDLHVKDTHNYVTADGAIHHNSAKTTGALIKILYMASLQEPSALDGIRRSRCVVVRNTAPQLRDTTISSWNYWFKDGVAGKWFATRNTFVLKQGDIECEVMFRALDTADDISRVLSLEVTFAVLDEFVQIAPEIVEALSGRCGRYPPKIEGGATNFGMWGASNPGEEDTWWHKQLIEDKPDNLSYFHQPSGLSPQAENLENLPAGYYENLQKGKSPSWVKQFIEAEWGYSVSGKPVVPTFSRQIHVSKVPLKADQYLPLVIGFDPGMHSALIFGQMDMYGRLHVLEELILEGYGAQRMCTDRLLPLIKTKYRGLEIIIAPDPAANSRTPTNEGTVLDVLRSQAFKKYWAIKVGASNLLAPRMESIEHFTTRLTERGPALVIDPSCKVLIKALASGWKYLITKNGDDKPTPEKNIFSHPGDAFGYLAQYNVENEAKYGRRGQNTRPPLPKFANSYNMR